MDTLKSIDPLRRSQLETLLAEYITRLDKGEAGGREQLLVEHPELADDLRSYFSELDQAAEGMPSSALMSGYNTPTLAADGTIGSDVTVSSLPEESAFGDYVLTGVISRGGMGVVYRARQVSLNRAVALKMILSARLAEPTGVQRFLLEAEAVANLSHPN